MTRATMTLLLGVLLDALKLAPGQEISLTVMRDGRAMDLKGRQPK